MLISNSTIGKQSTLLMYSAVYQVLQYIRKFLLVLISVQTDYLHHAYFAKQEFQISPKYLLQAVIPGQDKVELV